VHGTDEEINIRSPNVSVNIRIPAKVTPPRAERRAEPLELFRSLQSESKYRHMQGWLSQHHGINPDGASTSAACRTPVARRDEREGDLPTPPTVTRSGRISKPVLRFDDVTESLKQRESRDVKNATARSKLSKADEERKKGDNTEQTTKSKVGRPKSTVPSMKKK
jgi:hypothetical protein